MKMWYEMDLDSDQLKLTEDGSEQGGQVSRRAFLRGTTKKALYVTPVVLSLSASNVCAGSGGGWDSTCRETGSPCQADPECCGAQTCVANACA